MANFCIPKESVDKFLAALKDGTINPEKLAEMSSTERRMALEPLLGKDAAIEANKRFEQKILTKNLEQTAVTWAIDVAGLKTRVRQDIISKIQRMDERILDPKEEAKFLADLAAQKLGVEVTFEEVKQINKLSKKIDELQKHNGDLSNNDKRLEYGHAVVALRRYVEERKEATLPSVRDHIQNKQYIEAVKQIGTGTAGNSKAINSSMDNSSIFRQGWKVLWTHPTIWTPNALKSFKHLVTYKNQQQVLDALDADIVSRPTYDLMKEAKLDVGVNEEVFPTTLPEKIPGAGRIYKATENAYTAFVRKTRADVFDAYIKIAKSQNLELTPNELQSIGKMVNSLTGRGNLGSLEGVGNTINVFFFSPKFLKSQFDVLYQPFGGAKSGGVRSNFVRREAAKNLIKMAVGAATILAIAKMLMPDSVETDPRSTDFGKIKIGKTRFDVTGGLGSVIVLLARFATHTSKNAETGEMKDLLDPKFGGQNVLDVVVQFFEGKTSPVGSVLRDRLLTGETFEGKRPTVLGNMRDMFVPLPFRTGKDAFYDAQTYKQDSMLKKGGRIGGTVTADMLGIGANVKQKRPKGTKKDDISFGDIAKWGQQFLPK